MAATVRCALVRSAPDGRSARRGRREATLSRFAGDRFLTSFLVDTNVLSTGAPTKAVTAAEIVAWMDRHSEGLFLSVVTIAEIEDGIAKNRRQEAHRKADRLSAWLETVLHLYGTRILPINVAVARRIGILADRTRAQGHAPGFADLAIAATAQHHGCRVLTRNVRHFTPMGVTVHDPFEGLPDMP